MGKKLLGIIILLVVISFMAFFFHFWGKDDSVSKRDPDPIPTVDPIPVVPPSVPGDGVADPSPDPVSPDPKPEPPDVKRDDSPEGLIKQLAADNFRDRRRAEKMLRELGLRAIPPLKKAAQSNDPELNSRAQKLLDQLRVLLLVSEKTPRKGQAEEPDSSMNWPCIVRVTSYDEKTGDFVGKIEWTSLNSIHEIKGKLTSKMLSFKETKFIKKGNAILNCVYEFDLLAVQNQSTTRLNGTWKDPNTKRGGTIHIDLESPDGKEKGKE